MARVKARSRLVVALVVAVGLGVCHAVPAEVERGDELKQASLVESANGGADRSEGDTETYWRPESGSLSAEGSGGGEESEEIDRYLSEKHSVRADGSVARPGEDVVRTEHAAAGSNGRETYVSDDSATERYRATLSSYESASQQLDRTDTVQNHFTGSYEHQTNQDNGADSHENALSEPGTYPHGRFVKETEDTDKESDSHPLDGDQSMSSASSVSGMTDAGVQEALSSESSSVDRETPTVGTTLAQEDGPRSQKQGSYPAIASKSDPRGESDETKDYTADRERDDDFRVDGIMGADIATDKDATQADGDGSGGLITTATTIPDLLTVRAAENEGAVLVQGSGFKDTPVLTCRHAARDEVAMTINSIARYLDAETVLCEVPADLSEYPPHFNFDLEISNDGIAFSDPIHYSRSVVKLQRAVGSLTSSSMDSARDVGIARWRSHLAVLVSISVAGAVLMRSFGYMRHRPVQTSRSKLASILVR